MGLYLVYDNREKIHCDLHKMWETIQITFPVNKSL